MLYSEVNLVRVLELFDTQLTSACLRCTGHNLVFKMTAQLVSIGIFAQEKLDLRSVTHTVILWLVLTLWILSNRPLQVLTEYGLSVEVVGHLLRRRSWSVLRDHLSLKTSLHEARLKYYALVAPLLGLSHLDIAESVASNNPRVSRGILVDHRLNYTTFNCI